MLVRRHLSHDSPGPASTGSVFHCPIALSKPIEVLSSVFRNESKSKLSNPISVGLSANSKLIRSSVRLGNGAAAIGSGAATGAGGAAGAGFVAFCWAA